MFGVGSAFVLVLGSFLFAGCQGISLDKPQSERFFIGDKYADSLFGVRG
jgi:hypothetical protein